MWLDNNIILHLANGMSPCKWDRWGSSKVKKRFHTIPKYSRKNITAHSECLCHSFYALTLRVCFLLHIPHTPLAFVISTDRHTTFLKSLPIYLPASFKGSRMTQLYIFAHAHNRAFCHARKEITKETQSCLCHQHTCSVQITVVSVNTSFLRHIASNKGEQGNNSNN